MDRGSQRQISPRLRTRVTIIGEAALSNVEPFEFFMAVFHVPPLKRFHDPVPNGIVFIPIHFSVRGMSFGIENAFFVLVAVFVITKL